MPGQLGPADSLVILGLTALSWGVVWLIFREWPR